MREIKYRAFNKHTKKMFEVNDIDGMLQNTVVNCEHKGYCECVKTTVCCKHGTACSCMEGIDGYRDEVELMQFTGLHDKNGKELYEDYVVKLANNNCIWQVTKDDFGIPCFVNLTKKHNTYDVLDFKDFFMSHRKNDFEIIGNIYESPELLNGGSNERD